MAPPTKARPRVAYDLGRRGEALPDDWHDDPELAGSYESGVDDRDAAEAGAPRRKGPPKPRSTSTEPAAADDTSGKARRAPSGLADPAEGVAWRDHPLGRGGGGGLFLGVIGYCLGRAFLAEGPYGMWRWYSAKFTNKVLPRAAGTGQGSAGSGLGGGGGPPARREAA